MNILRQFWKDLFELPKWEWSRKYLLPPATLFFAWAAIGGVVESSLDLNDLLHVRGRISHMEVVVTDVVDKLLYRRIDRELRISIEGEPDAFRIPSRYDYATLLAALAPGDTVDIYHRGLWLTILGLGSRADIYQLEYHHHAYFTLEDVRSKTVGRTMVTMIAAIGFGAFWFSWRSTRQDAAGEKNRDA